MAAGASLALAAALLNASLPTAQPAANAAAPAAVFGAAGTLGAFEADADLEDAASLQNESAVTIEGTLDFGAPGARVETAVIGVDVANVRTGPDVSYDKLGKLRAGAAVTVLKRSPRQAGAQISGGEHPQWVQVRNAQGVTGWVAAELINFGQAASRSSRAQPDVQASNRSGRVKAPDEGGWMWPTRGRLSSGFGLRNFRYGRFHNGLDIANLRGTTIVAARGGKIVQAGWCRGYGYCVMIDHGDGYESEYGHMAVRPPVRVGQAVHAGQLIGYMGSTYDRRGGGYSTGNHLHFTVRLNGRAINPLKYLP
jgi:murein DD-endopeptidase MepM/ murein hydrolase activator NlpD